MTSYKCVVYGYGECDIKETEDNINILKVFKYITKNSYITNEESEYLKEHVYNSIGTNNIKDTKDNYYKVSLECLKFLLNS